MNAMRKNACISLAILLTLGLSSCITMFSSTSDPIIISTSPSEAKVTVDGLVIGTTPVTFDAKRSIKNPKIINIEKEGYKPVSFPLRQSLDGWTYVEIILSTGYAGTTSLVVDYMNDAFYKYDPKAYNIILEKVDQSSRSLLNQDEVNKFVLESFSMLKEEISKGHGESLSVLAELLLIEAEGLATELKTVYYQNQFITPQLIILKLQDY